MTSLLRWSARCLAAISLAWAPDAAAIGSHLIDADTGKPVADAWIIDLKYGRHSYCGSMSVFRTGDTGYMDYYGFRNYLSIHIHKRGYWYAGSRGTDFLLSKNPPVERKITGSNELSERIADLADMARRARCSGAGRDAWARSVPALKDMFDEAWDIALGPQDREAARSICGVIHSNLVQSGAAVASNARDYFAHADPRCNPTIPGDRFVPAKYLRLRSGDMSVLNETPYKDGLDRRDGDGYSLLWRAATDLDDRLVGELIARGANVNVNMTDDFGTPMLVRLAHNARGDEFDDSRFAIFERLLRAGADANRKDANGSTVLRMLFERRSLDNVTWQRRDFLRYLDAYVRLGGDPNALSGCAARPDCKDGMTALFFAQNAVQVRELVQRGADPNVRLASGETPLMRMLVRHDSEQLRAEARSRIPKWSGSEQEIWPFPSAEDYRAMALELVRQGASLEARDNGGKMAVELTRDLALRNELRLGVQANAPK